MSEAQTPEELERIERWMGEIEIKRERGDVLTADETAFAATLATMLEAEAAARDSFSLFYSGLSGSENQDDKQVHLPREVAAKVNGWIEARKAWDTLVTEFLEQPEPLLTRPAAPRRTGARLRATLPAQLRIPTAAPAKDALAALFAPHLWQVNEGGTAILARQNNTQLQMDCDTVLGLDPERAIQQIAKYGASAAQTFLTMTGLWLQQNPGKSHETYLTVHASDLLRFQGRKETPRGGYHSEDLLGKGRDVYFLSRISVPRSEVAQYDRGRKTIKTISIGRLLSLESLDLEQTEERGNVHSIVRFRYHLGREVYDWVCGDHPQYAPISGKLLTYHPIRQKYQILLGFCLAYYDRVNRKNKESVRTISLPALLNLAAIPIPNKRPAEFLTTIEDALNDLARDGVIPEIRLRKPDDWTDLLARRRSRDIIMQSVAVFPRLIPPKGEIP